MKVWADLVLAAMAWMPWRTTTTQIDWRGVVFPLVYYNATAALYRIMLTTTITKTDSALTTVEAKPPKARELH